MVRVVGCSAGGLGVCRANWAGAGRHAEGAGARSGLAIADGRSACMANAGIVRSLSFRHQHLRGQGTRRRNRPPDDFQSRRARCERVDGDAPRRLRSSDVDGEASRRILPLADEVHHVFGRGEPVAHGPGRCRSRLRRRRSSGQHPSRARHFTSGQTRADVRHRRVRGGLRVPAHRASHELRRHRRGLVLGGLASHACAELEIAARSGAPAAAARARRRRQRRREPGRRRSERGRCPGAAPCRRSGERPTEPGCSGCRDRVARVVSGRSRLLDSPFMVLARGRRYAIEAGEPARRHLLRLRRTK